VRRPPRVLLFALPLAFAAIAAVAALVLLRAPRSRSPDIDDALASADAALAGGYLSEARAAIEGIPRLPPGEAELMRVLKRAFLLSRAMGDFSTFADMAGRALAAGRGSARIRMAAGYAYLRAGRLPDAEKWLARSAGAAETGARLRGEAALRQGRQWKGSDSLTRDLLSLEGTPDPSPWRTAAEKTGDRRLSLDSALLAMEAGDVPAAAKTAREDLESAAFDEPASLILYDAGAFEDAAERIEKLAARFSSGEGTREVLRRADLILVLADCDMAMGRARDAEAAWQRAIAADPGISWTPYANLAALAGSRGDGARAALALADGVARFPGSRDLRLASARLAVSQGDMSKASGILSTLVAERPDDAESALLQIELQAPFLSPEAYRAALWKLFNRAPADGRVCTRLLSTLWGNRDWAGAAAALGQRAQAVGEGETDFLLFRGVVEALRGNLRAAGEDLQRSAEGARDGIARCDLALLRIAAGDARGALASLAQAREECEARGQPARRREVLARIELCTGMAMALAGDGAGARAALERARASGASSPRAALLMRKLEAGKER